jgi:hypothetical protein
LTTLTLLTRIYNANQLKQVDNALKLQFEGLDVEAKILGVAAERWVQIALSGEDESVATNYIAKEIGLCPINFGNVRKSSTLNGYVTNFEKNRQEMLVDVGVFEPKIVHATVPLDRLEDQLMNGRKTIFKKIAELFGFCENLPISIKVAHVDEEGYCIGVELSARQVEKYSVWRESLLDRLLVLSASRYEVEKTLEYAKLDRDVIGVEPLGMFEHALTCKLGTDAAGLIPKIGKKLPSATFSVFNASRIERFLEGILAS